MDKNIYDLINEIETDLEGYEKVELTQLEEKRIMKKFRNGLTKGLHMNKQFKKYIGVAAAAVIVAGTISAVPVMATTNPTLYKIASFLGIEKNMEAYETIVGKEVTKDGITMKINEVIIDNDKLLVSVTTTSEENISENYRGPGGFVYINGEAVNGGARWRSELIDDYTGHSVITFPLKNIPEGEVSVKIELNTPLSGQQRSPHWVYEFKADGEALKQDTHRVTINQTYSLENGEQIRLLDYKGNLISQSIYYEASASFLTHDMEIIGADEKGNKVVFMGGDERAGKGEFVVKEEYRDIITNAKTITCNVYVEDEKVGETFVIE